MEIESNKDLAQNTFIANLPDWLRWLIFLPCAILGPALIVLIQLLFQTWFLDIGENAFYLVLMRGILYGGGFVYIGSIVAPKYQNIVALLLLVILSMIIGMGLFSIFLTQAPFSDSIEGIIMIISGGIATFSVFRDLN